MFLGFVVFDTQLIIEKLELGDVDNVKHALDLFIDLVGVFVRVLVLLMRNAENKDDRRKRSSTSRR